METFFIGIAVLFGGIFVYGYLQANKWEKEYNKLGTTSGAYDD